MDKFSVNKEDIEIWTECKYPGVVHSAKTDYIFIPKEDADDILEEMKKSTANFDFWSMMGRKVSWSKYRISCVNDLGRVGYKYNRITIEDLDFLKTIINK